MKEAFDVKCNVKVLMDAFLEVYHLKSIHQNTVDRFLDHRGTTIALYRNGHSLMVTPNRRPDWEDPGTRGMRRIETATEISRRTTHRSISIPNLVAPVDPSGVPVPALLADFRHEHAHRMPLVRAGLGRWAAGRLWQTRIANFDRILDEDLQFGPQIQESLMSPGFKRDSAQLSGATHLSLARGARSAHRPRARSSRAAGRAAAGPYYEN